LPEWLRDKGMQVPPSSYQLMELEFGGDASSARFEVYMGLTVLLFGVICSIMSLSMLSRLRKTAAISGPLSTGLHAKTNRSKLAT
jgi:hypothetical protein